MRNTIAKVATKPKRLLLLVTIIAVALVAYLAMPDQTTTETALIQDIDYPVCTMDIPSSDCGQIEITAKLTNGTSKRYVRKGYMNGQGREKFDNDFSLLESAYRKKEKIQITTNNKNQIQSIKIIK